MNAHNSKSEPKENWNDWQECHACGRTVSRSAFETHLRHYHSCSSATTSSGGRKFRQRDFDEDYDTWITSWKTLSRRPMTAWTRASIGVFHQEITDLNTAHIRYTMTMEMNPVRIDCYWSPLQNDGSDGLVQYSLLGQELFEFFFLNQCHPDYFYSLKESVWGQLYLRVYSGVIFGQRCQLSYLLIDVAVSSNDNLQK